MRRQRLRTLIFLAIGLGAAGLALLGYGFGFLDRYERDSIDARFSIRGTQHPPRDVVVVKIDDKTFSQLPNIQWPYPRSLHGKVIDRLAADGAKVIAFDVQFSE